MTHVSPEGWNDYGTKHPLLYIQVGYIVWTYVIDTAWRRCHMAWCHSTKHEGCSPEDEGIQ